MKVYVWNDGDLYMLSALTWQEQIPASALKYDKHLRKTELVIPDLEVFKDFISPV